MNYYSDYDYEETASTQVNESETPTDESFEDYGHL